MITKKVKVIQHIIVTIDDTKFDENLMKEFWEGFYYFLNFDDHIEHLAQLNARGIVDEFSFIEGYGQAKEMGIQFDNDGMEIEIED